MVPDKFNMVDMGGIDLIESQDVAVDGLYQRLVESITLCRYQCLYNWQFNGIPIPPSYVEMAIRNGSVWINEGVNVDENDVIHIYSLVPEIIPLLAEENGVYNAPSGASGFNPVTVEVPSYIPVINPITITENGTYNVPSGVDGYGPVTVNVGEAGIVTVNHNIYTYTPNVVAQSAMSAGFAFTVSKSLIISKIRVYASENIVSAHIMEGSSYLASIVDAAVTSGQWNELALSDNVTVVPGRTYTVWYSHRTAHPRAQSGVVAPYLPFIAYLHSVYAITADTVPDRTESGTMMGADLFLYGIIADE